MKIACLQFAPKLGDVSNNLIRADAVLSRVDPDELQDLDLMVLPEMAFSGYNFKSLQHITPFLEPTGAGPSAMWARTVAMKHGCHVAVGYPEKVDIRSKWPTSPEYYNSLIMVNSSGETVANYRKSFLYYTDETWALEGEGFFATEIEFLGEVAFGICMDINPYKFEAPWHAFEFAHHVLQVEANLVIVSMAWLTREDSKTFTQLSEEPDMDTLAYWVQRLEPVVRTESNEEIIFVFCNRCGSEGEALFAGTSAVLGVKDGEVAVYELLGRGVKEMLVVDTEEPPFAKLVYRPNPLSPQDSSPTWTREDQASEAEAAGEEARPDREEQPEMQQASATPLIMNARSMSNHLPPSPIPDSDTDLQCLEDFYIPPLPYILSPEPSPELPPPPLPIADAVPPVRRNPN